VGIKLGLDIKGGTQTEEGKRNAYRILVAKPEGKIPTTRKS
jgi:hypothetical protein